MNTESKRKILGFLLTLAVAIGLFPCMSVMAYAEPVAQTHNGITFKPWTSSNALPDAAGNYYLTADVVLTDTWVVPEGVNNLCLNGYGIRQSASNARVIRIEQNRTLNLYDCERTTEHYVTLNNWRGTDVSYNGTEQSVDENGTGVVKVKGGYITGGAADQGGGILVRNDKTNASNATLNIYGGTILGNVATNNGAGGGIWNGGKLTIGDNVRIGYNSSAGQRSGIYNHYGELYISGAPDLTGNRGDDIILGEGKKINFRPFDKNARLGYVRVLGNVVSIITDGAKFQSDEDIRKMITGYNGEGKTIRLTNRGQAKVVDENANPDDDPDLRPLPDPVKPDPIKPEPTDETDLPWWWRVDDYGYTYSDHSEPSREMQTTPVYRLLDASTGEHAFTDSATKRDELVAAGWVSEGIGWHAPKTEGAPAYELTRGDKRFYTKDTNERKVLTEGDYTDAGVAFRSNTASTDKPVWRLCSERGMHFFTASEAERDALVEAGWANEGAGFYAA